MNGTDQTHQYHLVPNRHHIGDGCDIPMDTLSNDEYCSQISPQEICQSGYCLLGNVRLLLSIYSNDL